MVQEGCPLLGRKSSIPDRWKINHINQEWTKVQVDLGIQLFLFRIWHFPFLMSVRSISISISAIARISIHVPSRLLNSRRPPIALISISIPHVKKERKYNKKRNIPRKAFFWPNFFHHYKSINTNRILTPKPPPFPFFETFSPIFPIFPFIGINLVGTHFSLHRSGLFIEESSDNKKTAKEQTKTFAMAFVWSVFPIVSFSVRTFWATVKGSAKVLQLSEARLKSQSTGIEDKLEQS